MKEPETKEEWRREAEVWQARANRAMDLSTQLAHAFTSAAKVIQRQLDAGKLRQDDADARRAQALWLGAQVMLKDLDNEAQAMLAALQGEGPS